MGKPNRPFSKMSFVFSKKNLRKNGLQFLLGRTIVQENVYAKFWRESKEYYGLLSKTLVLRSCSTLC